jgi:CheY-like chemotaxis protein
MEVVAFTSSVEAAEFLQNAKVSMVVTDCRMPQMNGLDFIAIVRSFDPRVPIVMLTSDMAVKDEALLRGATAFIPKHDVVKALPALLERLTFDSSA